jgi:hypothetical protein
MWVFAGCGGTPSTPPTLGPADGAVDVDVAGDGAGGLETGTPPVDTGVPSGDTGVVPLDTGVAPRDTGVPPEDTGAAPADAPPGDAPGVSCPQAATLLDVSRAPGAGAGYPSPRVSGRCTESTFIVESNNIPHYTFVRTTPNALVAREQRWEVPRSPREAAGTTAIPRLGVIGFSVNGQPFFGPNEAAVPADSAWGDPIFNGITDGCLGHTAMEYHYHALSQRCLTAEGLVATPWTRPEPARDRASPVLGYGLDGFPVYGPYECADAACSRVVEQQSGYERIGNPRMNAWDAYRWRDFGDATHLDACNGHRGPRGDYHYHATAGFPYILGCFRGTASGAGGMMMPPPGDGGTMPPPGDGGTMPGPRACTTEADCAGACPAGSRGCTCADSPRGRSCVPSCTTDADCPTTPLGALRCEAMLRICVPRMGP